MTIRCPECEARTPLDLDGAEFRAGEPVAVRCYGCDERLVFPFPQMRTLADVDAENRERRKAS